MFYSKKEIQCILKLHE